MSIETLKLYSHGKILLTGEYVVLKGAKALALPAKMGQKMIITPQKKDIIEWTTYCQQTKKYLLKLNISKDLNKVISVEPEKGGNEIVEILHILKKMNPQLFNKGYKIETVLEFDRNWGLGSSASLVANLSKWAQVNPFHLLDATFEGSGYDVVVSLSGKSILFQRTGLGREWHFVNYYPPFHKNLFFVYLNKSQPTYTVIQRFKNVEVAKDTLEQINRITEAILETKKQDKFNELITNHEEIIGKIIKKKPVKQRLFKDFDGAVKSLGAWGGDLILASGDPQKTPDYFKSKGYEIIMPFSKIIKK